MPSDPPIQAEVNEAQSDGGQTVAILRVFDRTVALLWCGNNHRETAAVWCGEFNQEMSGEWQAVRGVTASIMEVFCAALADQGVPQVTIDLAVRRAASHVRT